MNDNRVKTYNDMVEAAYRKQFSALGVDVGRMSDLLMKDDPVINATAVSTAMLGPRTFMNLDQNSVLWKILPKIDFQTAKSGVRIVTAHATAAAGVAETGALVATDKPDLATYNITLKRLNYTWDITELATVKSAAEDGKAGGESNWQAQYAMDFFARCIDTALLTQNGTTADALPESLDRMIAGGYEVDNNSDSANASYTANDVDWYTLDRDSTYTYDAQVGYGTSAVDRALTVNLIDEKMQLAEDYGMKPERAAMLTKSDTLADWAALVSGNQRFNDYISVSFGVNGVQSEKGRETGSRVASYNDIPIFKSPQVVADGAGRIYGISLDHVEYRVASPVRHLTSPISNAILHDAFEERHSLDLFGELTALAFAPHFKIRDLA
jgi:hypothetical protein